ncbi:MAG: DUF3048 domain-containing protein [Massiliimalia sp.]
MQKRKRGMIAAICGAVCLAVCLSLSGCQKIGSDVTLIEETSSQTSDTSSEASPVQETGALNPLKGTYDLEEEHAGRRPVAVMINNHHASWPQYSISQADLIYELPVEGGYTRLMAMYADYTKAPVIGSIRSVRHDFVELAQPFDCIFVHWGGSDSGYSALRSSGLDEVDGMAYSNTYFYTDRTLNRSVEHCRFMKAEQLTQAVSDLKIDLNGDTPSPFRFAEPSSLVLYEDTQAQTAQVPLSGDIQVTYTYHPDQKKYEKGEYGESTVDGADGQPVLIDNVFILFAPVSLMQDGVHKDISLNQGSGWYLTRGTKTPIQWKKGNASSPMKYTLESGEELTVNPGNSWVLFAPTSVQERVTFG